MDLFKVNYENYKNIKVGLVTWNLAGNSPPTILDFGIP
jgi:hypothetical protein